MRIAIGSTNPVKFHAVKIAFEKIYPQMRHEFICLDVESGLSAQPFDDEIIKGAVSRAQNALVQTRADFAVGIEAGLENHPHGVFSRAWCAVTNASGKLGVASSVGISVPSKILELMRTQSIDLGQAVKKLPGSRENAEFNNYLTKGVMDRTNHYVDMIIYSLAPFFHQDAFEEKQKNIYCAGNAIAGKTQVPEVGKIIELLKERGFHVFSEYTTDLLIGNETAAPPSNVFERNIHWINQSEMMIAEVSQPTLGIGFEIAYAVSKGKKIIALFRRDAGRPLHPMIASNKSRLISVHEYTDETLASVLDQALAKEKAE